MSMLTVFTFGKSEKSFKQRDRGIVGCIVFVLITAATLFGTAVNDCELFTPETKSLPSLSEVQAPPKHLPSRSMEPEYMEIICEATAYTHTGNRTYTGTWPSRGTIAVDPKVIPLGSRLWVEGYGFGVAEDTGGAIKGHIVDVFLENEEACREWGRRKVKVRVYK